MLTANFWLTCEDTEVSERLLFKVADKLLENSQLNDKQIMELSHTIKERVAEKHGIK